MLFQENVLPSDAECERMLQEFARITRTDEACAHFFLQDFNWQLQASASFWLRQTLLVACAFVNKFVPALNRFFSYAEQDEAERATAKLTPPQKARTADKFTILSWNVDGLDLRSSTARFTAVCYTISKVGPDVAFLQEMTAELVQQVNRNLGGEYNILVATPVEPYFTVVLMKPDMPLISHNVARYEKSGMGRSMQLVESFTNGRRLLLLNTHLESMKEHSDVRRSQIQECYNQLKQWDDGKSIIIFGGDLNARNDEIGELPEGFKDAWVAAGSDSRYTFTWDTLRNDNRATGRGRCRFDRIFYNRCLLLFFFFFTGHCKEPSSVCYKCLKPVNRF
uniref:Endo/exonuclease/phosphatase domain-containing protein n=1 Tax=Gongylonema pulchrum TaxID=637853 RepID=A0A183EVU9_9BILA